MENNLRELTDKNLVDFVKHHTTTRARKYYGLHVPIFKNRGKVFIENQMYSEFVTAYFASSRYLALGDNGMLDIRIDS